jgi:signal transduction histidine kinase
MIKRLVVFFLFFIAVKSFGSSLAYNGMMDLRNWDFESNGSLLLKGKWEFYWNKYLITDHLLFKTNDCDFITLPSAWNNFHLSSSNIIKSAGFATFRLKILLPRNEEEYSFKFFSDGSSYRIYCQTNNSLPMLIGSSGIIGHNQKETVPQINPSICHFKAADSVVIFIEFCNFYRSVGGIPVGIEFNKNALMQKNVETHMQLDFFVFGCLVMIALYFFIFFLLYPKEKTPLWLGIFSILITIYMYFQLQYFRSFPISYLVYQIIIKLTYLSVYLTVPIFNFFINSLFPDYRKKIVSKIITIVGLFLSAIVILTDPMIFARTFLVFQLYVCFSSLVLIIYLFLTGFIKKTLIAKIAFFGFFMFFFFILSDMLSSYNIIPRVFYIHYGFLLFIFSQGIIVSLQNYNIRKDLTLLTNSLELKVQQRTKELELVNEQKTAFFINLAHESKTPLTIIRNSLEEYIRKTEVTQELKEIKYNIDLLLRNMVNFLDSEKLQKGQVFYNHDEVFCFSEFLSKKMPLFEASVKKRKIHLTCSISPGFYIQADSLAIDRIVNNLMDNAIKYNKDEGSIEVVLEAEGDQLVFTVRDSGEGITKENLQAIFNPYYQISRKKRNIQGIGMGLFIVSEILKSLDGEIVVDSQEGKGSVFRVCLKRYRPKDAGRIQNDITCSLPLFDSSLDLFDNPDHLDFDKNTVLIVEDNITLLRQIRNSICNKYNVLCARSGKEALDILEKYPKPDLVLSDIMMDEMDGYELFYRLKEREDYQSTPFIFLTAKTSVEENIEGLSAGAVDYIYKPFSMEVLIAKMEALFRFNKTKESLMLSDKYASVGKLAGGITHQILNPLAGVLGPLEFIKNRIENAGMAEDKDVALSLKYIYQNLERIEKIVKSLRVLVYNKEDCSESFKLKSMLEAIVEVYSLKVKDRIEFINNIPEDFFIRTNFGALNHIIMNVVSNAVDSIKDRGTITLSGSGSAEHFWIEITDTGEGIDEKYLKKIFAIDYTTKPVGAGTGIGLYLAKELAERYHIGLDVCSELQKGTTFTIYRK